MFLRSRDLWNACHVTCCYGAESSGMLAEISCGILATLHVATLPRSLECLPLYMLLRCRDLWNACHVTCCYAAEISGMLATLHVATLPRSPVVSLLRYMLLRCRELWNACHVTCCYAAEISGMLATLHVAMLPRSLECLPRYMWLRCRDLWNACHATCCYAAESSGMLAALHVATLQRSPVVCLLRYMLLRCRDLWNACHVTCSYAAEISCGILATLHVATLPRSLECLPRYMLLRCIWGGVLHCSRGFRSVYIIISIIPYVLYRCEMMGSYVFSCFGFSPLQVRDSGAWHALNCCRCTGIIIFSK